MKRNLMRNPPRGFRLIKIAQATAIALTFFGGIDVEAETEEESAALESIISNRAERAVRSLRVKGVIRDVNGNQLGGVTCKAVTFTPGGWEGTENVERFKVDYQFDVLRKRASTLELTFNKEGYEPSIVRLSTSRVDTNTTVSDGELVKTVSVTLRPAPIYRPETYARELGTRSGEIQYLTFSGLPSPSVTYHRVTTDTTTWKPPFQSRVPQTDVALFVDLASSTTGYMVPGPRYNDGPSGYRVKLVLTNSGTTDGLVLYGNTHPSGRAYAFPTGTDTPPVAGYGPPVDIPEQLFSADRKEVIVCYLRIQGCYGKLILHSPYLDEEQFASAQVEVLWYPNGERSTPWTSSQSY